jgi:hypothetical protein
MDQTLTNILTNILNLPIELQTLILQIYFNEIKHRKLVDWCQLFEITITNEQIDLKTEQIVTNATIKYKLTDKSFNVTFSNKSLHFLCDANLVLNALLDDIIGIHFTDCFTEWFKDYAEEFDLVSACKHYKNNLENYYSLKKVMGKESLGYLINCVR